MVDSINGDYRNISNIIKVYPNMLQIVIYHNDYQLSLNRSHKKQLKKEQTETQRLDSIHRSLRRSTVSVKDIIVSNKWDFWCTFTFSPNKVDRYDFERVSTKMHLWLKRQPNLRYIIVPEQHKDGAYHFHALIANYTGPLKPTKKRTKNGQFIFRANFGSGFHEFVKIDGNNLAIAQYMTKNYLTKNNLLLRNRKRYWTSRGLDKPLTLINGLDRFALWDLVKKHKPTYINESYELHNLPHHLELNSFQEQTEMHFRSDRITQEVSQTTYRADSVKRSIMSMESS